MTEGEECWVGWRREKKPFSHKQTSGIREILQLTGIAYVAAKGNMSMAQLAIVAQDFCVCVFVCVCARTYRQTDFKQSMVKVQLGTLR